MYGLRERASTLAKVMDLPVFLMQNRKLEPISTGGLSTELLSAFHFYLSETQEKMPELKPPFHEQLIKHIDNNNVITLVIVDIQQDGISGIVFGPIFEKNTNRDPLVKTLMTLRGKHYTEESARKAVDTIPVKDALFIQAWGKIVLNYMSGQKLHSRSINTIRSSGNYFYEDGSIPVGKESLEDTEVMASYAFEREIAQLIALGDKEKLKDLLLPTPQKQKQRTAFLDHFEKGDSIFRTRRIKNALIGTNSIFRLSSESAGLSPIFSHSISEQIIQEVEGSSSREELLGCIESMIEKYCNAINNMAVQNRSATVMKLQRYIIRHLDEKIQLEELGTYVDKDPAYLCRLFKKECHMTIGAYTTMLRVNEAKWLLESTDISILDIATRVGIPDQSHFAQVFGKAAGVSPTTYRKQRRVLLD